MRVAPLLLKCQVARPLPSLVLFTLTQIGTLSTKDGLLKHSVMWRVAQSALSKGRGIDTTSLLPLAWAISHSMTEQ
jgi:hypothetical protein